MYDDVFDWGRFSAPRGDLRENNPCDRYSRPTHVLSEVKDSNREDRSTACFTANRLDGSGTNAAVKLRALLQISMS